MARLIIVTACLLYASPAFAIHWGLGEERGYDQLARDKIATESEEVLLQIALLVGDPLLRAELERIADLQRSQSERAKIAQRDVGYTKGVSVDIYSQDDIQHRIDYAGISKAKDVGATYWRQLFARKLKASLEFAWKLIPWYLRLLIILSVTVACVASVVIYILRLNAARLKETAIRYSKACHGYDAGAQKLLDQYDPDKTKRAQIFVQPETKAVHAEIRAEGCT